MNLTTIFDRPPRILVADDDWLNRDLLQAYLNSSGCEVLTAACPKSVKAVEKACKR